MSEVIEYLQYEPSFTFSLFLSHNMQKECKNDKAEILSEWNLDSCLQQSVVEDLCDSDMNTGWKNTASKTDELVEVLSQ